MNYDIDRFEEEKKEELDPKEVMKIRRNRRLFLFFLLINIGLLTLVILEIIKHVK